MNKKSYNVVINGPDSYIQTEEKDGGSFVTFREAKTELARYFESQIKNYLEKMRQLSTASLGEFLVPLSALEKKENADIDIGHDI